LGRCSARSLGELPTALAFIGIAMVDDVRDFVAELAKDVEAGDLAAKTVNNALGTLGVWLNDAVERRLIPTNPAPRVQRLPPAHIERDYLRLDEMHRYLDARLAQAGARGRGIA
jgi:hypothetical protein